MQAALPKRKNARLNGYDYSHKGAYFVTICTRNRLALLADVSIVGAESCRVNLTPEGMIAEQGIETLSTTYQGIRVVKSVVIPNHVHMIIAIGGEGWRQDAAPTLSRMINQYKRGVSMKIGTSIWQKSFYEHIIRNEEDFFRVWQYIEDNSARWVEDEYYTAGYF